MKPNVEMAPLQMFSVKADDQEKEEEDEIEELHQSMNIVVSQDSAPVMISSNEQRLLSSGL